MKKFHAIMKIVKFKKTHHGSADKFNLNVLVATSNSFVEDTILFGLINIKDLQTRHLDKLILRVFKQDNWTNEY